MIKLNIFEGKKFGVLGLGKSGLSIIASLIESNIKYICYDDNEVTRQKSQQNMADINLIPISSPEWKKIDILVCSPGIDFIKHSLYETIIENRIKVICDIELLYSEQYKKSVFIGITGTNGKSTTTALTNHILQSCNIKSEAGGNIGIPALSLSMDSTHYVLELSSYQLDLLNSTKFSSAALLNITPDHLERHNSMENYVESKMRIFNNADSSCFAFINIDNSLTKNKFEFLKQFYKGKLIGISTEEIGQNIITLKDNILYDYAFEKDKINIGIRKFILGKHNDQNIVVSYALARSLGLKSQDIIKAILSFKGLEHRMEFVTNKNQTIIVNDSKGTNSDATEKALLAYDNIYWIVGGLPKKNGINDLVFLFPKIKKAYLIGTSRKDFAELMQNHHLNFIICNDLKDATEKAFYDSTQDFNENVLLLSPACASFDEWPSFEVRGNSFKLFINELMVKSFKN